MPRRRKTFVPDSPPFVGDRLQLRVGPLVAGGSCIGHLEDGRVVLVALAAPGELVEVEVERISADYLEAATVAVVEPSPDRVDPRCSLFGACGGCQLQHLAYDAQLRAKTAIVVEQLRRIGRFDDPPVRPICGAAQPWGYRNHVRFSTGAKYGDVGFVHRRGRGLLRVESCPIADPWINSLLPRLQGKGAGLHQVQVRYSCATGSYLVMPTIPGLEAETGQNAYLEELCGRKFVVSASAFFQVNGAQAAEMARLVGEALPPRGSLLVDAFAGVGTFAALFADRFDRVLAIEESASATRDARANLADLANVAIRVGKVEDLLPALDSPPDAVVLDPPRAGCAPPVIEALVAFQPAVVVYVSCNPATLARDLRLLVDGGYRLDAVTPLDMFPQTGHIEAVARLSTGGRE